ncbi:hypothetical protein [Rhizobium herbae]|uniref:hypothetical protein n=1 Tax=Rhizobium herbae TaxID=508661 RepID=UPI001AE8EDFD|nr:hypothetical protein [Rhizobium herbae]
MSLYEEPISGKTVAMMQGVLADECKHRNIHSDGLEALDLALVIMHAFQHGTVDDAELVTLVRNLSR